ncbi:MAG: dihydrofolate reductase family protein [Candidatus Levybacteria bacterium]|nr:dihydrofolate reductase family protein [Candidatus Levybacteria bacterium]
MLDIPKTTLFLIESLDGKITTGDVDSLDVDKDFAQIPGIKEGLYQYYDIEKTTDLVSLNSGRVMEKVGANSKNTGYVSKTDIDYIVIDNRPHLTLDGTEYMAKKSKALYLVTTNKNHPAYGPSQKYSNIKIIYYEKEIDFTNLFTRFKKEFGINNMTIQTGGTLNAVFLRLGLIDTVSIVIAPSLVGGSKTQSSIGGESIHSEKDLQNIRPLKLVKNETLKNNYIHLVYKVLNS